MDDDLDLSHLTPEQSSYLAAGLRDGSIQHADAVQAIATLKQRADQRAATAADAAAVEAAPTSVGSTIAGINVSPAQTNNFAGIGQGIMSGLRGVEEAVSDYGNNPIANRIDPVASAIQMGMNAIGETPDVIKARSDQAKEDDKRLLATTAGQIGSFEGGMLPALLPGGQGNAAKTAGTVLTRLAAAGGKNATTGAVYGAMQPVGTDGSRVDNIAAGAAAGVAAPVIVKSIGKAAGAGYDAIKYAYDRVAPWRTDNALSSLIQSTTGMPASDLADKMRSGFVSLLPEFNKSGMTPDQVAQYARGATPTSAEAALSPNLWKLESNLRTSPANPQAADAFRAHDADTAAAELTALQARSGTVDSRAAAKDQMDSVGAAMYGPAFASDAMRRDLAKQQAIADAAKKYGQTGGNNPSLLNAPQVGADAIAPSPALQALQNSDTFAAAEARARKLAGDRAAATGQPIDLGDDLMSTLQGQHYVKLALDDLLEKGTDGTPLARNAKQSVLSLKKGLLAEMDKNSPAYANARAAYTQQAAPYYDSVAANDVTRAAQGPSILNPLTGQRTPTINTGAMRRSMMDNGSKLSDLGIGDQTLRNISGVLDNAERRQSVRASSVGGSPTAERTEGQQLMNGALGAVTAAHGLPGVLGRAVLGTRMAGTDRERLGQLLLDPSQMIPMLERTGKTSPMLDAIRRSLPSSQLGNYYLASGAAPAATRLLPPMGLAQFVNSNSGQ